MRDDASHDASIITFGFALHTYAMTTRHESAYAAIIAAVAGGALLTASLLQRRRDKSTTSSESRQNHKRTTLEELLQDEDLTVKPIGTVRSIYRLCVGTPRQGLLAPHARGRLELNANISQDAVLELDGFSHVWVVFVFHLNTLSKNHRVPAKIAPPALGGEKVGVLATRSPHRMNPIGMTLCKLDSITLPSKDSPNVVLNVSGLDLCEGTPILDIKPYVPHYDSVPAEQVRLPSWVSGGLATRRPVHMESKALNELEAILVKNPNALEFYGERCGDKSLKDTMNEATHSIAEVLSIDVRSKWQTQKARDSKFQAERAGRIEKGVANKNDSKAEQQQCTQQLDNLLIYYSVEAPQKHERSTSEGSGAEDVVRVNSIRLLTDIESTEMLDVKESTEDNGSEADVSWQATANSEEKVMKVADTETKPVAENKTSLNQSEESLISNVPLIIDLKPPTSSEPATGVATSSTSSRPPTDADYKSLKTYWSQAASQNTPTGLIPDESLDRQKSQKFFVFSDKPVAKKPRSSDEQTTTTATVPDKDAAAHEQSSSDIPEFSSEKEN